MMRRSLVFMLTIIFVFAIFAGPAAPRADAVVVSSIIVGTVIAAMAAAGIGLTVSGMTSTTLSDWVSGKLQSWATSLGGSVEDHINGNLITTTASGIISIGTSAAHSIAQFLGWLQTDEGLSDNDEVTVIAGGAEPIPCTNGSVTLESIQTDGLLIMNNDVYAMVYGYFANADTKAAGCYYTESNTIHVVVGTDTYNGTLYWSEQPAGQPYWLRSAGSSYDGTYSLYVIQAPNVGPNEVCHLPRCANLVECIKAISGYMNGVTGSLTVETGVITVPTIDTNTQDKWFLDVGASPGTTIETVTDGVIADTIEGDLTVSGEVAEDEPEFVIDEPIAVTGLSEVFPFCIPFDIYALLSALSADPQTPVFTARFVVPGIIDEEFTIDLTPFNAVAQIVRTMELLAFIIGLALVTRERFLRS